MVAQELDSCGDYVRNTSAEKQDCGGELVVAVDSNREDML